jgi:hypothetical protein
VPVRIDYGLEVVEVYYGNAKAGIHEQQLALLCAHWMGHPLKDR